MLVSRPPNEEPVLTARNSPSHQIPLTVESAPRVRLIVESGSEAQAPINCRRVVTLIGSRPGCRLNLQHRLVAPVHVAIVNAGTHVVAVDLLSKDGTKLNGLKMLYEHLTDGDMLEVGRWTFRVEIEEPEHDGDDDVHQFGLDPTPHIVALEQTTTRRILRPHRDVCTIGRRHGCDITISSSRVSRAHCLLLNYFGYPALCDLFSRNHTLVNGQPIAYRALENGDMVAFGDSRFRVRLFGSALSERVINGNSKPKSVVKLAPPPEPDMIDIEATESAQRWSIAEKLEKAARKR